MMQQTISKPVSITGIGLHSGAEVSMTLMPAAANAGVVFVRSDVSGKDNVIPARWDYVVDTRLCTVIGNDQGVTVGTIEHLMAALRGMNIDNVIVRLDGPEVPVLDGSSAFFVKMVDEAGIKKQNKPRRAIKILKDIKIQDGDKYVSLTPSPVCRFQGRIDFDHAAIGTQSYGFDLVEGSFENELSNCRTFGFLDDVQALRKAGLALGGSLDNAIVLDKDKILNKDGLRRSDEFIRHKLLDAIGDTYLAGVPIIGAYDCYKPGHALNNEILHLMFSRKDAWTYVEMRENDTKNGASSIKNAQPVHFAA